MKIPINLVVVDLEFNGPNIIEIGAVFMDKNMIIRNTFQSFVYDSEQPQVCQTPEGETTIDKLCNINWDDIKNADKLSTVLERFQTWLETLPKNLNMASIYTISSVGSIRTI